MPDENWNHDYAKSLGIFLNGDGIRTVGPKGEHTVDDSFYLMFNAHYEDMNFTLPSRKYGTRWQKVIDTHDNLFTETGESLKPRQVINVHSRSIVLLKQPRHLKTHEHKRK